jgi:polyisoprenoid-binding protein YceI
MPRLLLTLAATLAGAIACPASAQSVVPAQSEISFVSKQMGVPVEGRFKKWSAQIEFDPRKPGAGKIAFTIDTASASFGAPETDAEVPTAAWFDSPKFPQARFQSASIKSSGAGKFDVNGKLTIKGSVQDVVVPVAIRQSGSVATATGDFTIKRLDFRIGEGEWADTSMVANDIQVKFKLILTGMAPL